MAVCITFCWLRFTIRNRTQSDYQTMILLSIKWPKKCTLKSWKWSCLAPAYLPDLVITISVPYVWNCVHKSLASKVTFGSSVTPSSSRAEGGGCKWPLKAGWPCCRAAIAAAAAPKPKGDGICCKRAAAVAGSEKAPAGRWPANDAAVEVRGKDVGGGGGDVTDDGVLEAEGVRMEFTLKTYQK